MSLFFYLLLGCRSAQSVRAGSNPCELTHMLSQASRIADRIARMRASILVFTLPVAAFGQAGAWYQHDFPPEEFRWRWEKVFDKIGVDAVAVVQGAPQTNGFIMPRQSNEFYYLFGIETPYAYLLLDGRNRSVTLYLPPRNQRLESAEGKVLSADDADEVKQRWRCCTGRWSWPVWFSTTLPSAVTRITWCPGWVRRP